LKQSFEEITTGGCYDHSINFTLGLANHILLHRKPPVSTGLVFFLSFEDDRYDCFLPFGLLVPEFFFFLSLDLASLFSSFFPLGGFRKFRIFSPEKGGGLPPGGV